MKRYLPLLVVLTVTAACQREQPYDIAATPVRTEVLKRAEFAPSLTLLGVVRAAKTIPLHAVESGTLVYPRRFANGLETGVRVTRGEVLAEIRNDHVVSSARQARLQMEAADADFERVRRSHELGVVSGAEFSSYRVRAALAREQFTAASRDTSRLRVVAPESGTLVVAKPLPPGMHVTTGSVIAEVATSGAPIVESNVAAADREALRPGLSAKFGDSRARIAEVASVIDASGTARVVAAIVSGNVPPPGSGVELEVELEKRADVLTVPEDAIVAASDGPAVFVASMGEGRRVYRVKRVAVETGGRAHGRVEIRSGLRDGDRIVVSGADALSDDSLVTEAEGEK